MKRQHLDVHDFLDHRTFLKAYYTAKKKGGRFSYRAFSRRAGLKSPNHLKLVIDGDRNLTPAMAIRYADAIGLEGEARDYFLELVRFGQARTSRERNAAYERLSMYRGYRVAQHLDLAQAEYHSTWYLPAIRELILRQDFRDDPKWIARQLVPRITASEAAAAMKTLNQLGLIEREGERWVQGTSVVTTGAETRGLHIGNYHRTMMQRAAESIDQVDKTQRDISSLTFCVSETGLQRIKQRIQEFRREIIALAEAEEIDAAQVLQLNIQLFPLSNPSEDR